MAVSMLMVLLMVLLMGGESDLEYKYNQIYVQILD